MKLKYYLNIKLQVLAVCNTGMPCPLCMGQRLCSCLAELTLFLSMMLVTSIN